VLTIARQNCEAFAIRPRGRLSDGTLTVIPIDDDGEMHDTFELKFDELNTLAIAFLHDCALLA
jgi:hypothetical protein